MTHCDERAGFLFDHECHEPASDQCSRCEKAICQKHTHNDADGLLCTACTKRKNRKHRNEPRHGVRSGTDHHGSPFWSSPFFYGYYHYGGYGTYDRGYWGSSHTGYTDANDFTEADAGSLTGDAGEGFEQDLGGS